MSREEVLMWKGIMYQIVSGVAVMVRTLRLLNMLNKQIAVKQQESTVSPESNIQRWKEQKPELMPILCKNCHLYRFKDKTECQCHAASLLSERCTYLWG
jgi:hypothetical protein